MKYFSTSSAFIRTVRVIGFYPSLRVATRLAKAVGDVLELDKLQIAACSRRLTGDIVIGNSSWTAMTPSEQRVFNELVAWWSIDKVDAVKEKSFVVVNLNLGRTLVVLGDKIETSAEAQASESESFSSCFRHISSREAEDALIAEERSLVSEMAPRILSQD